MRLSLFLLLLPFLFVFCSGDNDVPETSYAAPLPEAQNPNAINRKYMALGDSYTIGESVCSTCGFPIQLRDSLESRISDLSLFTDIISTTGWTTTNLKAAIATQNPSHDYDLVTLLIGVNNQYQHKPFTLYQQEFPELVTSAIAIAKGDKAHVIVVSIPDYAYTPYGTGTGQQATITAEIDQYNNFARTYCESHDVAFVNITDITRQGLSNPELVAGDGLHPSATAYAKFVARLRPLAQAMFGF